MIMSIPGAVAPVVFGGKIRAVMAYLDPNQDAGAQPVAAATSWTRSTSSTCSSPPATPRSADIDYALDSNSMYDLLEHMARHPASRCRTASRSSSATWPHPQDAAFIQTNVVRVNGRRQVYIPVYRQVGASTLDVVETLRKTLPDMQSA